MVIPMEKVSPQLRGASIRTKLIRIVFFTCGVAILVACCLFLIYDRVSSMNALEEELATLAEMMGTNTTAALEFNDAASAAETLSSLSAQEHVVNACVYTAKGTVLAKYARAGADVNFVPPVPQADTAYGDGLHGVVAFHRIQLKGDMIGTVYLMSDFSELRARLIRFTQIAFLVVFVSLITAYLLAVRLQRSISGPILDLARTALAVAVEENYSIRVEKKSDDEVGFLFDRFNQMLGRIQQSESALRNAHDELEERVDQRTRELQVEVAERKQAERALEERTVFLDSQQSGCHRRGFQRISGECLQSCFRENVRIHGERNRGAHARRNDPPRGPSGRGENAAVEGSQGGRNTHFFQASTQKRERRRC